MTAQKEINYAAPEYMQGTMPKPFEQVAQFMLTQSAKGVSMDAKNKYSHRNNIKPLNPIYTFKVDRALRSNPNDIVWFDNAIMKTVKFSSFSDKMKYVLTRYGVPNSWIEAFLEAHIGRKWSGEDIDMIHFKFRFSNDPLEKVLTDTQKWFS